MRSSWPLAFLPILPLVPACAPEPTFDERFEEAASRIERKAEELDRELARTSPEEGVEGDDRESAPVPARDQ